jgi:pyridoxal phosphate enzyme (YggS family)
MTIADNISNISGQICTYCSSCNRNPGGVTLLAVSKTKSTQDVSLAYRAGLRHFGENYCQEAINKQAELGAYDITWHFIGPIQSNKTKLIARHFSWVHSVDSIKAAKRLSEQRPDFLPPINVCLQVNISQEASKSGIELSDLPTIYNEIKALPRLNVRGLMAIPALETDFNRQRQPYRLLTEALNELHDERLDTLSFGMSDDLKAAIYEGATIVRIGTAIFGKRI